MTVVLKIISVLLSLQNLVWSQTRSCPGLLGLSTGAVQDWQIAASSTHHTADSYGCSTKWARLYMPGSKAWCARHRSQNEWILVDLGVPAIVSGIMMQGRGEVPEWTSSFSLAFSVDAFRWNHVTDLSNNKKVYRGNNDSYSTRFIAIDPPIEARFIRLHILTWEGRPALKLELVGCQECNNIISEPPFTKMAASSVAAFSKRPNCAPENAYFNSFAGWCPKKSNPNQWLQIDLGPPKMVTAISTKGRWDIRRRQWVTRYTATYSNDSILWFTYKDGNHLDAKIFGGNMDMITERTHYLNSPFIARYIRIHPVTWHHGIGLRAAVVGCPRKGECGPGFLKLNDASGCLENLAYGRNTWVNDKRQGWRDWQTGRAALAVDGIESDVLSSCAILDNYYVDHPVWMVDLKKKKTIQGVYFVNWQGKGQDKITSYRDYVHNLEKLTIYVSNKPKLDSASLLSEAKCATISRHSGVLFNPQVHVECGDFLKGRYVYIRAVGVPHRRSRLFFAVLCEVMVY